jgi:hypothetical protein
MNKNKLPPEVLAFFKQQGSIGGKLGGSKAWENLTPEERSERAKKAVAAREAKRATKKAAKSAEVRTKKAAAKKRATKENAKGS